MSPPRSQSKEKTKKTTVSGRTGRRPGPSTTREEILAAARECFAKRGYDGTSLRTIAAEAGVDPALVRRFFGSKEGVLIAALTATFRPDQDIAEVVSGDLNTLGDQIIRYTLSVWEQPPTQALLVGMLRSACTNERAARLLRDFTTGQILSQLAGTLSGREAELRASAIGSQIAGIAFYRYVLKVEPLASASPETLRTTFGPTLQRYLTGQLKTK